MQEMSSALRFAAGFEELQGQLLALVWELTAKPFAVARLCAAQLAAAVSPSLPHSLVRFCQPGLDSGCLPPQQFLCSTSTCRHL